MIEVIRVGQSLFEEPVLDRRQRHAAGNRSLKGVDRRRRACDRGQLRDGLMIKELFRRESDSRLGCPRDYLDAYDRIAAELEEVVVYADVLDTKHLRPDL